MFTKIRISSVGGVLQKYYVETPGSCTETLVLHLSGGTYKLIGSIPPAVRCSGPLVFTHEGGNKALSTPKHAVDIALRIKRAAGKHMEAE